MSIELNYSVFAASTDPSPGESERWIECDVEGVDAESTAEAHDVLGAVLRSSLDRW